MIIIYYYCHYYRACSSNYYSYHLVYYYYYLWTVLSLSLWLLRRAKAAVQACSQTGKQPAGQAGQKDNKATPINRLAKQHTGWQAAIVIIIIIVKYYNNNNNNNNNNNIHNMT